MSNIIKAENTYCAHNYLPIPVVIEKGKGVFLWDNKGKRYFDMMSGYSAVSHGHLHPKIVAAMNNQLKKVGVISRAFHTPLLPKLAKQLCTLSGMDQMLPMNTGAEAVETAIKAARRWGHQVKGIPEDFTAEIIVAKGNFHGRTTTIIGFSSEEEYKRGFGPFTPGFVSVKFGDEKALERAITPNTCAFLVEPIQGEAGIVVPQKGYLKNIQKIAKEHNILLIVDEIQSGLGRTGKMFAFQHEISPPDGLILGKALGGGMLAISALLGSESLMGVFNPGSHGSTFGGNPLACSVAIEALQLLEKEKLIENSATLGKHLISRLKAMPYKIIKAVRGKGLWVGVDINPDIATARYVCEVLMENGVLSKETHDTVVRIAPPLVITQDELDQAIDIIDQTLKSLS